MDRASGKKVNKSLAVLLMCIKFVSYVAFVKLYVRLFSYHFRKQFSKIYLCSDMSFIFFFAQDFFGFRCLG